MNGWNIFLIVLIAAAAGGALFVFLKSRKRKGCSCGDCANCTGCPKNKKAAERRKQNKN